MRNFNAPNPFLNDLKLAPNYPVHIQLLRVTSATPVGSNTYSAYTQQGTGSDAVRDREACYVFEPNNVDLETAYYLCRLIGSYSYSGVAAPLYVTVSADAVSSPSLTVYARWYTGALPAFTNTAGVLTASVNGALTSTYADGVTPAANDVFLYAVEGASHVNYMVYKLTQLGTAGTPWIATPVSTGIWELVAAAQVLVGPEGTNDKETVWAVKTANPITPATTAIKFARIYQEDRWVKLLTSAGTGWDTTTSSSGSVTIGTGSFTFLNVGAGLNITAGDTFVADAGSGNTMTLTATAYSGTTLTGTEVSSTGSGTFTSWTVTVTSVQGYYPGTVYFNDKTSDVACWVKDANSNAPSTGVFHRAARNFNKTLDAVTRGFYETDVTGTVVKSITSIDCVDDVITATIVSGTSP